MEPDLADDLIWGIKNIAQEINRTERQTHYLADQKLIPAFKVGNLWAARRSAIRQSMIERENAARAA
jgi:hypothetical protein